MEPRWFSADDERDDQPVNVDTAASMEPRWFSADDVLRLRHLVFAMERFNGAALV